MGMVGGSTGRNRLLFATTFLFCFVSASAFAEDAEDDTEAVEADAVPSQPGSGEEAKPEPPKQKPKPADEGPQITVSGRVFALGSTSERSQWQREVSVPSARAQVEAEFGIARAVIEADIASKNLVKDAFIRLEPIEGLRVYAGQFKAPFLARELQGRWSLPLISRGLVDDYLTDQNQLGGRRLGAMGEVKVDAWREFEVQFGVFQGAKDEIGRRLGEDLSARVAFEPWNKRLDVGVSSYFGDPLEGLSRFSVGADARFDVDGFAVSGEAVAGRLPVGRFTGELLLVSYRFPLGASETWSLEPVIAGEALQVFGDTTGVGGGALAGLNLHYGDRIRLQTQLERALGPGDTAPATQVDVQLGARF